MVGFGHVLHGTPVHEIQITAVPELNSYLLILLGDAALIGLRRRQKLKNLATG